METTTRTKPRIGAWGEARILKDFGAEIRRRGGRSVLATRRWASDSAWTLTPLSIRDRQAGLVLLGAGQWHQQWKKAPGRLVEIAYLCGWDDNGPWAASVPGQTCTVASALKALTPAFVAEREHLRQGDVYLVRMERASATTPSGEVRDSHLWDASTRTLTHVPVKQVQVEVQVERRVEVCKECATPLNPLFSGQRCPADRTHRGTAFQSVRSTSKKWRTVVDEDAIAHAPLVAPAHWPGVKVVEQNRHRPAYPTAD